MRCWEPSEASLFSGTKTAVTAGMQNNNVLCFKAFFKVNINYSNLT